MGGSGQQRGAFKRLAIDYSALPRVCLQADILEKNTGVKVFKHSTKKPGCWPEIFEYLKASEAKVERPDQVAVVGDRLFTDILMANMMGSWGLWIKDGVRPASEKFVS